MHLEGLQNTGTRAMKGKPRAEVIFLLFHEKNTLYKWHVFLKNSFTEYGIFFSLNQSKFYVGKKRNKLQFFFPFVLFEYFSSPQIPMEGGTDL